MDHRLLALLEPPKVGRLRKLYRSYFGEPTGQHALNPLPRKPYAMPDALRYRVRAAALRPKRETYWDGSLPTFSTSKVEDVDPDDTRYGPYPLQGDTRDEEIAVHAAEGYDSE